MKMRFMREDKRLLHNAKRAMASVNLSSVSLCEEDIPGASFHVFLLCAWICYPS